MKSPIEIVQQGMKDTGFYNGSVDGKWGSISQGAWDEMIQMVKTVKDGEMAVKSSAVGWSAKVSPEFISEVRKLVAELGMDGPDAVTDMLSCMAFETGETFSPSVKSPVSSATGLIQFMEATAREMGTTTAALASMTAEEQLRIYVRKYFMKYKGRIKNLGDLYMAILWPAGIGKPDDYVLWDSSTRAKQYAANRGLDLNKDAVITRGECLKKINEKKVKGLRPENCRPV
jgi:hypothetical protein